MPDASRIRAELARSFNTNQLLEAVLAGAHACRSGRARSLNPHPPGTASWDAWDWAWSTSSEHRASPREDKTLVALFRRWATLIRASDMGLPGVDHTTIDDEISEAEEEIAAFHASGPLGLAVKLHVALCNGEFARYDRKSAAYDPADVGEHISGEPPEEWLPTDRLLWNLYQDLLRIAGIEGRLVHALAPRSINRAA